MEINEDVLAGKWKQIRGRIQERRGQLTASELDRILGGLRVQVGLLQERRGKLGARLQHAVKRMVKRQA